MKDLKGTRSHTHMHAHTHSCFTVGGGLGLDRVEVFAEEVGFKVFFEGENGFYLAEGGWERVP